MASAIDCSLVVVAHPDDEALSTGGYLLDRKAKGWETHLLVVFGRKYSYGRGHQRADQQRQALRQSSKILGVSRLTYLELPEGDPQTVTHDSVLQPLESMLTELRPSEIVIHDDQDRNQDHCWLNRVCRIAVRPWNTSARRVLLCQSPDGQSKAVNHYVPLTESQHRLQMSALECYVQEQRTGSHPRSPENLDAWQRVHGSFCNHARAEPFRTLYSKDSVCEFASPEALASSARI